MFLRDFTADQKTAFLVLADQVILADGKLAPEEANLLKAFKLELGREPYSGIFEDLIASIKLSSERTDTQKLADASALDDAMAAFTDRKTRVSVMLELIALAHCDGDFDRKENEMLQDIRRGFRISTGDFTIMTGWAIRQLSLVAEAKILMEEGA